MKRKTSLIILCSLLFMLCLPSLSAKATILSNGQVKFYYLGGCSAWFNPGNYSAYVGDGYNNEDKYVKTLQGALKYCGCDPGKIDGKWGPNTKAALYRYQQSHSELSNDYICGRGTWRALAAQCGTGTLPTYPPAGFAS